MIFAFNINRFVGTSFGIIGVIISLSLAFAPAAYADAGVGMLMVMSVPMWAILLLFIIPLEAWIAKKTLGLSGITCLKISVLANLVSTIAGILFTCASLLCYECFWYHDPNIYWIVPVNELCWCVPCFYASVWIEGIVAGRFVERTLQASVHKWAVQANLASYSILFTLLFGILVWSVAFEFAMLNSDDYCDVDRISAERVWRAQYNHMKNGTGRFRKRKIAGCHWVRDGKPMSWLKEEYIRGYEALSDDKTIGILQAALKKYDCSSSSQKKAIPDDDLSYTLSTLADCYDKEKLYARARDLRLRSLRMSDDEGEELRLANEYVELSEFRLARKIYEKLAGLDDFYYRGHALIGLGTVAEKLMESDQAENCFQKAKQLFSDRLGRDGAEYTEACVKLAEFYIAEKRYSDAERLLLEETKASNDRGPKSSVGAWPIPEYLFALSDCYFAQGDYRKAENCIKQAMRGQSAEDPPAATKKYAEFLQRRGFAPEASIWFQRARDTAALQQTVE